MGVGAHCRKALAGVAPEVHVITGAVGQGYVDVAVLLPCWEVALAMHAEREHCWVCLKDEGIAVSLQDSPQRFGMLRAGLMLNTEELRKLVLQSIPFCGSAATG